MNTKTHAEALENAAPYDDSHPPHSELPTPTSSTALTPSSVPPRFARFAERTYQALGHLQNRVLPPEVVMMNLINSFELPRCIWVAVELGVADELSYRPKPIDELARTVGADVDALYRVMRALASAGIFEEIDDKLFVLNRLAACLRADAPLSLRGWARYVGADWYWSGWGSFMTTVRNGRTIHENVHGRRFFEYYAQNGYKAAFDQGMSSVSALAIPAIIAAYDFSRLHSIVDVAGGDGSLLAAILHANSGVRGTLLERPDVIERARQAGPLTNHRIADRATFVTGDLFESVPAGHDAYMMKWILHDWNDEDAHVVLRNVRRASRLGAKLLVAEMIVDSGNRTAKLLDVAMLALTGGRERTELEYRLLFRNAGFELVRVEPTASPYSVLEAVAV